MTTPNFPFKKIHFKFQRVDHAVTGARTAVPSGGFYSSNLAIDAARNIVVLDTNAFSGTRTKRDRTKEILMKTRTIMSLLVWAVLFLGTSAAYAQNCGIVNSLNDVDPGTITRDTPLGGTINSHR